MALIKRDNNKCWKVCGQIVTTCIFCENVKWCSYFGKRQFLKVLNIVTLWLINAIPRYIPKRYKNIYPHETCTYISIETLFIITKKWKQSKFQHQLVNGSTIKVHIQVVNKVEPQNGMWFSNKKKEISDNTLQHGWAPKTG